MKANQRGRPFCIPDLHTEKYCWDNPEPQPRAKHAEEGIQNIENCARCHRNGSGEGGEGREGGEGGQDD